MAWGSPVLLRGRSPECQRCKTLPRNLAAAGTDGFVFVAIGFQPFARIPPNRLVQTVREERHSNKPLAPAAAQDVPSILGTGVFSPVPAEFTASEKAT